MPAFVATPGYYIRQLVVRNVSPKISAEDLEETFAECPGLTNICIARKQSVAYFYFDNSANAEFALLASTGMSIKGKPFTLEWAHHPNYECWHHAHTESLAKFSAEDALPCPVKNDSSYDSSRGSSRSCNSSRRSSRSR